MPAFRPVHHVAAAAVLSAVCAPVGTAQSIPPLASVQPVVVSAARLGQARGEALPEVTVITREEIDDSLAFDLATLLRRVPGVEFAQSGGIGSAGSLFLRGSEARQTLVLVDGVRINSASLGDAQIAQIQLDQVERIEVVRGNVSSLYGSGAVGGVVQIFTRAPGGETGGSLGGTAGSRRTANAVGRLALDAKPLRIAIDASSFRTDGYSAIDPARVPAANPDRDGYRNDSLSASAAIDFAEGHLARVRAYRSSGRLDFDSAWDAPGDVHNSKSVLGAYSVAFSDRFLPQWTSDLSISRGTDFNENFTNGASAGSFETVSDQVAWQNEVRLGAPARLLLGVEHLRQRVDTTAYADTTRRVTSALAGLIGRWSAHQIQLNLRTDDHSDFGRSNTWLAAWGYALTPAWRVSARASTAFSAPTFNQLYYPGYGNPDLRPEKAKSGEVGVQYATGTQLARLTWFRTDFTDLVTGLPFPPYTAANVAEARVDGVELSWSGEVAGTQVRAALTLQDPVDETTGAQLRRRAKRFGNVGVARDVGGWRLGAEAIASGPREDAAIDTFEPVRLPGYALVNLTARLALARAFELALRVDNLFDASYQLAAGYDAPPRGVFATVTWRQ